MKMTVAGGGPSRPCPLPGDRRRWSREDLAAAPSPSPSPPPPTAAAGAAGASAAWEI